MFCSNCGNSLPESSKFCANCGSAVNSAVSSALNSAVSSTVSSTLSLAASTENTADTPVQPVAAPEEQVKKSSLKKLIPVVTVLIAVVLIVGLTVTVALPAFAGNSYQKAEEKFLNKMISEASNAYLFEFSVGYESSRDIKDMIGIDKIELSGSILAENEKSVIDFTLSDATSKARAVFAFDGTGATIALPDITEYFLSVKMPDIAENDQVVEINIDQLNKTLKNIAKEYFKLANEKAVVEKRASLSEGGVTVTADKYTMTFTNGDIRKLSLFAIEEINKNQNLIDYFDSIGYDIKDELGDFEKYSDDYFGNDDKTMFRMTVWVKGDVVIARGFDNFDFAPDLEVSYKIVSDGKKACIKAEVRNDSDVASFIGNFENTGGLWSGTAGMSMRESREELGRLDITCKDYKKTGDKIEGQFSLNLETEDAGLDLIATFGIDGNKQTLRLEGKYSDYWNEYDFGALTLGYAQSKTKNVEMPKYDDNKRIVIDDYSDKNMERMRAMMDGISLDFATLSKFMNFSGFSDFSVEELAKAMIIGFGMELTGYNPFGDSMDTDIYAPSDNDINFNGIPVSFFFDLSIDDIEAIFGDPSYEDWYLGGPYYYYEEYDILFFYDDGTGEITCIMSEPGVFEVDGSALSGTRQKIISLLGNPYNEGWAEGLEVEGIDEHYFMEYLQPSYSIVFEMPGPDDSITWVNFWKE